MHKKEESILDYCSQIEFSEGYIMLRGKEEGLIAVDFVTDKGDIPKYPSNQWTELAKQQLTEYLAGKRQEFDIPLIFQGTHFQNLVWKALLTIPYGTTVSYKEICKRIGRERAYQAVGTAVGHNPFFIIAPCHRVVASDGSIGGFSLGLKMKRKLFEIEGIKEKTQ